MEHKATKTERALCDVITSMDAQMKAKDDRITELEAEVAELKEIVRILARSNMLLDKSLEDAIEDRDTAWSAAITEAAQRSKAAWDSGYDATPHILALKRN